MKEKDYGKLEQEKIKYLLQDKYFTCVRKMKGYKEKKIQCYCLSNIEGTWCAFTPEQMRTVLINKMAFVDNLQIDKAGRLADKSRAGIQLTDVARIINKCILCTCTYICTGKKGNIYELVDVNGSAWKISEKDMLGLIKQKKLFIVNVDLSPNYKLIKFKPVIENWNSWNGLNAHLWMLRMMSVIDSLNNEQRSKILMHVKKKREDGTDYYGMDTEDLIKFFTLGSKYGSSNFWYSDTAFRDTVFNIFKRFGLEPAE